MKPWALLSAIAFGLWLSSPRKPAMASNEEDDEISGEPEPVDLQPCPGHPYVLYGVVNDPVDGVWLELRCEHCDASWKRRCKNRKRIDGWVWRWALLHSHGHQPVLKSKHEAAAAEIDKGCSATVH